MTILSPEPGSTSKVRIGYVLATLAPNSISNSWPKRDREKTGTLHMASVSSLGLKNNLRFPNAGGQELTSPGPLRRIQQLVLVSHHALHPGSAVALGPSKIRRHFQLPTQHVSIPSIPGTVMVGKAGHHILFILPRWRWTNNRFPNHRLSHRRLDTMSDIILRRPQRKGFISPEFRHLNIFARHIQVCFRADSIPEALYSSSIPYSFPNSHIAGSPPTIAEHSFTSSPPSYLVNHQEYYYSHAPSLSSNPSSLAHRQAQTQNSKSASSASDRNRNVGITDAMAVNFQRLAIYSVIKGKSQAWLPKQNAPAVVQYLREQQLEIFMSLKGNVKVEGGKRRASDDCARGGMDSPSNPSDLLLQQYCSTRSTTLPVSKSLSNDCSETSSSLDTLPGAEFGAMGSLEQGTNFRILLMTRI
ncbi:hypothetical protein BDV36DRAFT_292048 [Aspergillus pseudocaelatus]|uniref:Uncharacterized protein n=1 Tax=Aspergillus pseudocaelatus TaxID=1825620 RepID=A0ABQ6WX40_9EURO|nr:hypothetical protein BDV36DRAFT_292048 [Aspergillus pseudocaelatus]